MGYCIRQEASHFKIRQENFGKAFEILKNLAKQDRKFGWTDRSVLLQAESLEEHLEEWRWNPQFNDAGDIVDLEFTGEKYGCDDDMFEVLAAVIEDGSYIEMVGEDDAAWRWNFNGGKMTQENLEEGYWE